jgi:hypothetical protein
VPVDDLAPGTVTEGDGATGGVDDVREQDGGQHAVDVFGGLQGANLLVRPPELLKVGTGGCLRLRDVDEQHHAGGERAGVGQAQVVRVDPIAEQVLPAAEDHGVDEEAVLVHQVMLEELVDEIRAAEDHQVAAGELLEPRDLGVDVA